MNFHAAYVKGDNWLHNGTVLVSCGSYTVWSLYAIRKPTSPEDVQAVIAQTVEAAIVRVSEAVDRSEVTSE